MKNRRHGDRFMPPDPIADDLRIEHAILDEEQRHEFQLIREANQPRKSMRRVQRENMSLLKQLLGRR